MNKKLLAIFFIVVLLTLALSVFAACDDGGDELPDGVYYIPPKAPSGDLPEVTKPDDYDGIANYYTREDCEWKEVTDSQGLTYKIRNGKAVIDYFRHSSDEKREKIPENIVIPTSVQCYGYDFEVEIAEYAFYQIDRLESVVIENGVKVIGIYTFASCHNLKSVVIPASVEEIKEYAFIHSGVESVVIEDGLRNIGVSAFEYTELSGLTLPDTLQRIGERAFYGSAIQSVEIKSAIGIGDYAFSNCVNLKDVTFPNNLEEIGTFAFSDTNIQSANIQSSISIGEYAFSGCANLIEVTLPDNLKEIGSYAFCDSAYLRVMTIPASVERIGYSILDNSRGGWLFCEAEQCPEGWDEWWCKSKLYVVWDCNDKAVTKDGTRVVKDGILYYALSEDAATAKVVCYDNWSPRKEITVPSQITVDGKVYEVTEIGDYAFVRGTDIKKAVIGDSVTTIGMYAFYESSLKEVVLPLNLEAIDFYAFAETKLTQVVLPENIKKIYGDAFDTDTLESVEFTGHKTWRKVVDGQYVYLDVSDPVNNVEILKNISTSIMVWLLDIYI